MTTSNIPPGPVSWAFTSAAVGMGRDRIASAWRRISRMSTIRDMRMSDAVEWSIHCCTRARRPAGGPGAARRPAGRVPRRAAGLPGQGAPGDGRRPGSSSRGRARSAATGWPGRRRTSRCSTSCSPSTATSTAFRCSEIRQRGPAAIDEPGAYRRPCGIARAMWRAEDAWRAELAATTVGDMVIELFATVPAAQLVRGRRVDPGRRRTTKEQDMKVFVAGATGVLGRATVPRLVAAGHEVRGAARSPEKADQLRAQGAEPVTVDLFDPASVRARRRRLPGRGPHGHAHPAAHQGAGRATPGPPTTASAARAPSILADALPRRRRARCW